MANFGFNLKQILFLSEFHNLLISLLSKHLLKHSSFFYNDYLDLFGLQVKWKTLS